MPLPLSLHQDGNGASGLVASLLPLMRQGIADAGTHLAAVKLAARLAMQGTYVGPLQVPAAMEVRSKWGE